jgi:cytochrome c556
MKTLSILSCLLATLGVACEQRKQAGAPAPGALAAPQNPVQAEMRLLHEATRDWVTAIAQNQLAAIPTGISRVHAARMVTEQALATGEYRPPKAGADLEQFKKQDEAFHDELVKLLRAAKANDLVAATRQLGTVLEGCTSCHAKFRF